ncbi:hypothetical protein ACI0FT_01507 [Alcaligenes nematophilus]
MLENILMPTSDIRHPTSDIRHPTSDIRYLISGSILDAEEWGTSIPVLFHTNNFDGSDRYRARQHTSSSMSLGDRDMDSCRTANTQLFDDILE